MAALEDVREEDLRGEAPDAQCGRSAVRVDPQAVQRPGSGEGIPEQSTNVDRGAEAGGKTARDDPRHEGRDDQGEDDEHGASRRTERGQPSAPHAAGV